MDWWQSRHGVKNPSTTEKRRSADAFLRNSKNPTNYCAAALLWQQPWGPWGWLGCLPGCQRPPNWVHPVAGIYCHWSPGKTSGLERLDCPRLFAHGRISRQMHSNWYKNNNITTSSTTAGENLVRGHGFFTSKDAPHCWTSSQNSGRIDPQRNTLPDIQQ